MIRPAAASAPTSVAIFFSEETSVAICNASIHSCSPAGKGNTPATGASRAGGRRSGRADSPVSRGVA